MAGNKLHKSKDSNLIGILILGIGIIAFLAVAYFAYQTISPPPQEEVQQQNDVDSFKQARGVNRAEGQSSSQQKKKTYKRQKSISEKEVAGLWEAKLKSGKALLEMEEGVYRLVLIPKKSSRIRYYSNGHYKITDDLIVLSPNAKWGPPKSGGYNYRSLTSAKITVIAAKYKGKLIWQVPPKDAGIYVPSYHAVLDYAEDNIAVWNVLE